jgi:hypothetical protein
MWGEVNYFCKVIKGLGLGVLYLGRYARLQQQACISHTFPEGLTPSTETAQ